MLGASTFVLLLLTVLIGGGIWIGLSLIGVGVASLRFFRSLPVSDLLAQNVWNTLTSPELIALPLFILMGEILHFTRAGEILFKGLAPVLKRVPGGLLHINVAGSMIFAAMCGSSAATAATVGRITLPELESRGYARSLRIGSLAGSATLGFLIPPSIPLIIYGMLSDTSILQLFVAGIVPGVMLAGLFSAYIVIATYAKGVSRAGRNVPEGSARSVLQLIPLLVLIGAVIGSMYFGFASPTEAAAVGAAGAICLGVGQRTLNWENLAGAALAAVNMTCMIILIMIGAVFLSVAAALLGIPQSVARAVAEWNLSPMGVVVVLIVLYMVLGCLFDGLSMLVLTLPVTLPLVLQAGFDKIWFGIFLVIVIEMAQITPPVGFNLFVTSAISKESIGRVAWYSLPFLFIMVGFALFVGLVPGITSIGLNPR